MVFLLNHKLFWVFPVLGRLKEEGRSEPSISCWAQGSGESPTQRPAWKHCCGGGEGRDGTHTHPSCRKAQSPLLTNLTFSESCLYPPQGQDNWIREEQPLCHTGPGTPSRTALSPRDERWSNCSLNMTSEICSKDLGPIYHCRAIIRFVNIESRVVFLTRDLITLLLSSCTHCWG